MKLTSSDPVSEGLAFLGAMTGESDPSKSNWKITQRRRQNHISSSLKNPKITSTNDGNWRKWSKLILSPGRTCTWWRLNEIMHIKHLEHCLGTQVPQGCPLLPYVCEDNNLRSFRRTRTTSHIQYAVSQRIYPRVAQCQKEANII